MRKFTILLALLCLFGVLAVNAQKRVITGKVTAAEDNSALPGVTVLVKGTTIGTVTDVKGEYQITVPEKSNTLVFSFIGRKTVEFAIGNNYNISIAMEEDILKIDEVVVTAIGISREAKALGYSVQNIGNEVLEKAQTPNFINSLNGRVAGLQVVNSSGAAGSSAYMTIRGAASITGNNQPLIVIDGVPIDNGGGVGDVDGVALSNRGIDINPDDIASIAVLKGGAAVALYGLRAANGAIIITTKKGGSSAGKKVSVSWNSSISFEKVNKLPELQTKYGQGRNGKWMSGNSASWGPLLDTCAYSKDPSVWLNPDFDVDGAIVGQHNPLADPALGKIKTYNHYDFFEQGNTFNNSVNIAGGSDVSTYYLSFSDMTQKGVIPNNKFKKNTFKMTGETKINDHFKVSGSTQYLTNRGDRIQQGSNVSGVMLGLLRTPPTFDNAAGYEFPDGTQRTYRLGGGYDNPYWTANNNKYTDNVDRMIGHFQLDYLISDWITITYRLGADFYNQRWKDYFAINSRAFPAGRVTVSQFLSRDYNSDLLINFRKKLANDLEMNFTLGHNMSQLYSYQLSTTADGLDLPKYYNLNNSSNITSFESTYLVRRAAIFGDLGFAYKSFLFLNITGRNDWSTTLPADNNSFFYPSFSAGFVFTELDALKSIENILPFGKIRASYAIVALDATAYNTVTPYVQAAAGDGWTNGIIFPFMGYTGFTLSDGMGNSTLVPEKTRTWEVGADLKFVKNRLGLDISYFNNYGTNLLLPVTIANSTGFASFYQNAAEMSSKGIEIVGYVTPIKKDFQWDIQVNFSKINNVVEKLAEGVDNLFLGGFVDPQIRAVAGEPYRSIYGYDWLRDSLGNVLIDADTTSPTYGFPVGDYSSMKSIGKVDPDWTMGITNSFTYKGFTLSFLWDIKKGGLMWNGTRGALYYFGTHKDTETRNPEDEFIFEGVKAQWDVNGNLVSTGETNDIKVVKDINWYFYGEGSGFTGPTIDFIENSGWVRLRDLYFGYQFAPKILDKTFVRDLTLYFYGRNLLLFTDYKGIDPETNLLGASNAQGMDYFNMPGTKSWGFGLKAGF